MIPTAPSWGAETFDRLYAASDDPWSFATSPYEREKYAATIEALGGRRFASGFEAGCSIGVLTLSLAQHCDHLLAVDISEAALGLARARCAGQPHIRFARAGLPLDWPVGAQFDLIVFSEILYFLDEPDLKAVAHLARDHLLPGGMVVLVNWTGATDTPLTGQEAAAMFVAQSRLSYLLGRRHQLYRLDVLQAATQG